MLVLVLQLGRIPSATRENGSVALGRGRDRAQRTWLALTIAAACRGQTEHRRMDVTGGSWMWKGETRREGGGDLDYGIRMVARGSLTKEY